MYLINCIDKLIEMHIDLVGHIKNVQDEMYKLVKEEALTVCKYSIGTTFESIRYGRCTIIDIQVELNRKDVSLEDTLFIFNNMYKPYYKYVVDSEKTTRDLQMNLLLFESDIDNVYKLQTPKE